VTRLSAATLHALDVPVPAYDRASVDVGIVHVGVGGFHRAHEAVYVDRLLALGELRWGICGVGTQPSDRRMRDVLREQDRLFTVLAKHPDGRLEPRVVGSLVEHLYAPDDTEAVIERMAAATTRIISLTITEGGYSVDPATGCFTPDEPAVLIDLQRTAAPLTVFGLVTEAIVRRRARRVPPFSVVSCDNVAQNGVVAREAFSGYASLVDERLGDWVRSEVPFPSSMVDRITPATTDDDRAVLAGQFGVEDAWPVVCEPYLQWVLEDVPEAPRPPWEQVGVQIVPDVHPYELMKLRLLNAGHQAIGYLGYLAGHRYTDEVCHDEDFSGFLLGYLEDEATPTLPPVPGIDLGRYSIRDTLARLCALSSDRIPGFLLPVVRDQLARGGSIDRSALICAAWAQYAAGRDDSGEPITVVDRRLEVVASAAAAAQREPAAFLRDTGVFADLAGDPRFVDAFTEQLHALQAHGSRGAVRRLRATLDVPR
jgi:mannitol 2-dehydrogenase